MSLLYPACPSDTHTRMHARTHHSWGWLSHTSLTIPSEADLVAFSCYTSLQGLRPSASKGWWALWSGHAIWPITSPSPEIMQMATVVRELAAAYASWSRDTRPAKDMAPAEVDACVRAPLDAHRTLVRALNKSGQYGALRTSLKAAVVRQAQERWGSGLVMDHRVLTRAARWGWE